MEPGKFAGLHSCYYKGIAFQKMNPTEKLRMLSRRLEENIFPSLCDIMWLAALFSPASKVMSRKTLLIFIPSPTSQK